ncbi:GNAT family N-acetyltransferase [Marispirochaeta aestuarii]|uniref:GNAT family N-acetyltransferase n=1 Tax=Marispirochaeta aestuarii TaxID=1963862 RepID=UPI002ABD5671|nr:GNAT family N-acetyltransferase [Marispirochaeta aestuarii]
MVREARLQDSKAIAEIIVETWKYAYTGIVDKDYVDNLNVQSFIQIMMRNLQQKKETIFVYEEDETIKGFISGKLLKKDNYQCEIVGFYVLPEFQQAGIGKILFQHINKYFSERNCHKMILWTLKGAKNNSFYEKNGGVISHEKLLKIGEKEYAGVGYSFNLHSITGQ